MKHTTTFTLAAALLACALPLASAWSVDQDKQRPASVPANPPTLHQQDSQEAQQPQPEAKTFRGRISRSGQKFVLEDASLETTYQLDDQKKAQQYQGKNVRVTGTLGAENNLIRVQTIEEGVSERLPRGRIKVKFISPLFFLPADLGRLTRKLVDSALCGFSNGGPLFSPRGFTNAARLSTTLSSRKALTR